MPTDDEWTELTRYVIGDPTCNPNTGCSPAGIALKTDAWGGDNSSGFTALPAGVRDSDGDFFDLGDLAGLWSSSVDGADAWGRVLFSDLSGVDCSSYGQASGFSVRCLKN